jgi:OOP family OmpA-OmpF porin
LFECGGSECGGFDFRFATEVLPAPDMHVDLTDFRFLSASKGAEDHLSILVSRSENAGFVQMIRVTPVVAQAKVDTPIQIEASAQAPVAPTGTLEDSLSQSGRAVLGDLTFETGSAALGAGPFRSLQALAGFLLEDPARRVALVGHTDAVGTLDNNVALSKRRAAAVLERLAATHDVPRSQLEAEGMGYLSPIAPNLTDEGREANRRVEVVLLHTE